MVKLIVFDLDGTLLNTLPDIHRVLNSSLKEFGLPGISVERTMQFVGNGAKKLVERAVGESGKNLFDKVYAHYSRIFSECGNELTRLYEGEEGALEKFTQKGIKLAIVTNKPQKATQNVCKKYLSRFSFQKMIGQSDLFPLKPDSASTLSIMQELGVQRDECLFVGDGETDVITAKNAGVKCVSVLWGFRSKFQLEEAGGNLFASTYDELADIVLKL